MKKCQDSLNGHDTQNKCNFAFGNHWCSNFILFCYHVSFNLSSLQCACCHIPCYLELRHYTYFATILMNWNKKCEIKNKFSSHFDEFIVWHCGPYYDVMCIMFQWWLLLEPSQTFILLWECMQSILFQYEVAKPIWFFKKIGNHQLIIVI
jgi:hypothetical protein